MLPRLGDFSYYTPLIHPSNACWQVAGQLKSDPRQAGERGAKKAYTRFTVKRVLFSNTEGLFSNLLRSSHTVKGVVEALGREALGRQACGSFDFCMFLLKDNTAGLATALRGEQATVPAPAYTGGTCTAGRRSSSRVGRRGSRRRPCSPPVLNLVHAAVGSVHRR